MIELSRVQDEEVGDGTTSVIILAGELLSVLAPWLERKVHPTELIKGMFRARDDALQVLKEVSREIDRSNREEMLNTVKSCIGTKFISRWSSLFTSLAVDSVGIVAQDHGDDSGSLDIDLKRFVRVEKIPGGEITDSRVLKGVILNKDITHSKMRREIDNPRVILMDTGIEYKKGENQTIAEITADTDFERLLQIEEESLKKMCDRILALKPDLVITEK